MYFLTWTVNKYILILYIRPSVKKRSIYILHKSCGVCNIYYSKIIYTLIAILIYIPIWK